MVMLPEHWTREPETHDYPAARDYLSLLLSEKRAKELVGRLRRAPLIQRKGKDILRASRLELLSRGDPHVVANLDKVVAGHRLSPVLLVRGSALAPDAPLIIADGYHRVWASYWMDENALIPCKLIG